ncbi:DMT family transporter [Phyllobacterium endophyticum]|uniref:EamA family transporter n=1 Tax=Phyllobacterium endophyticum TaxID=1149773 RepID=A0A2P7ALH0_9HYPH|nr:EamA family transporter [Phyllobacterium endophyticum]MBB3236418.1 drug/metabolite transporter (DMT)-like permease [Phyllobacterium endophyticum]PSH55057.1 EamA family transporter [Phyllobacterium endophyticum]TYR39948.1 EamA family transporter [Phyllobacterium endophyticum]
MATFIGFLAIIMWAMLALFTDISGKVPPFQLTAMTFAIGACLGVVSWLWRPGAARHLRQPAKVWLLGVAGLFGYHFLYFTALRNAPAVDASLIAYLWPLFIVVGSALMPGEKLRWFHVLGTVLGLAGTVLIITKGGGPGFDPRFAFGYAMAGLCALTWAAYSLLSRRFSEVPTDAVTGFCIATSIFSLISHLLLEQTVWPEGSVQWLAVLGLGLFPVGAAFYVWDYGVKRGNIQVLGAASYAAPLLSTLVLIIAGVTEPTERVTLACLLITLGAVIAAKDMLFRRRQGSQPGSAISN